MKLLTQYHQSLQSTDAFFNKLNGDIKASGMTTAGYIQIIDEITGQFDHLARGLDDVTSAMRTLGHTGLLTQEQMQDAMKAMFTPHGTPVFNAAMTMMAPPQLRGAGAAAARIDTGTAASTAYQTMQEFVASVHPEMKPEEVDALLKQRGITQEGFANLNDTTASDRARRLAEELDPSSTSIKKRDIGGSLDVLRTRRMQQKQAESLVNTPGPGAAISEAFQMNQGPSQAAVHNLRALSTLLPMATGTNLNEAWKTFVVSPEKLPQNFNVMFNKLLEMANMKPEEANKTVAGVQAAAAELVTQARTGKVPMEMQQGVYGQLADALGVKKTGRSQAEIMKDVQDSLDSSTENQDKGQQALEGNFDTLTQQILGNKEMMAAYLKESQSQGDDAQKDMKEALGFALTKSGTYLEQIYTFLSTKIYGLMTDLVDGIASVVPGMKHTATWEAQKTAEKEKTIGINRDLSDAMRGYMLDPKMQGSAPADIEKAKVVEKELRDNLSKAQDALDAAQSLTDKDPKKGGRSGETAGCQQAIRPAYE